MMRWASRGFIKISPGSGGPVAGNESLEEKRISRDILILELLADLFEQLFHSLPNMTGRQGHRTMEMMEEVPRRTSLVPLRSLVLCFV